MLIRNVSAMTQQVTSKEYLQHRNKKLPRIITKYSSKTSLLHKSDQNLHILHTIYLDFHAPEST